jgi:RNA polymerase sigma-70 factor (ECF subfamily)
MIPTPPDTRVSLILRLPDAANVAAWDEFVAIYGPLVFRMARRQGLQPADADDLVQEVFASVAKSVAQWLDRKDRGSFRAWLLRIAKNAAVNFLTRRRHGTLGQGGEQSQSLLAEVQVSDGRLSSEFDLEYRREVFRWAADQVQTIVSQATWRAFWLTHVENRPIAETAKQLGTSEANVYIARSRVMARLKEMVRQFEADV